MKKETTKKRSPRAPTLTECWITLILIVAIAVAFSFSGLKSVMMMMALTVLSVAVGMICGYSWSDLAEAGAEKIKKSAPVMLLLLVIGVMLAAFMYS